MHLFGSGDEGRGGCYLTSGHRKEIETETETGWETAKSVVFGGWEVVGGWAVATLYDRGGNSRFYHIMSEKFFFQTTQSC